MNGGICAICNSGWTFFFFSLKVVSERQYCWACAGSGMAKVQKRVHTDFADEILEEESAEDPVSCWNICDWFNVQS